jgi:hypothetical protein
MHAHIHTSTKLFFWQGDSSELSGKVKPCAGARVQPDEEDDAPGRTREEHDRSHSKLRGYYQGPEIKVLITGMSMGFK